MKNSAAIDAIENADRIVIKVGSALLVDNRSGQLKTEWLTSLCQDIAHLSSMDKQIVLVSSGAIAIGRHQLGLARGKLKLEESQAAAAAGQIALAHAWGSTLSTFDLKAAQILLTLGDTEQRRRYLNARGTISTLLKFGAIPVINENDTVATTEIRYGDNDRLGARVAAMIEADCLILLSDVDGLYTADPTVDPTAEHVPTIAAVTDELEKIAGGVTSDYGSGGMITKIKAARIATDAGCDMIIASGKEVSPIGKIRSGDARCTLFQGRGDPHAARKAWIAGTLETAGDLVLDDGAVRALSNGKSLLPAGVKEVHGTFDRGDSVRILDLTGKVLGVGLSAYASRDANKIKGHKSGDIEALLGYRGRDEMIHRDDLVLQGKTEQTEGIRS